MSYRFMRMMVFFDLPTETPAQRKEYSKFRKYLVKSGFMMMQESVYCKLLLNQSQLTAAENGLRKNRPGDGLVQLLTVTEKQYSKMQYLVGRYDGDIINSDERFIQL